MSICIRGACQADTSQSLFYNVYTKVLTISCGIPACHDGSFEPDFRTPESAYYTLVYHPVRKNNATRSYTYRVVPNHPEASVMYQRITRCCFVNANDRMPLTILASGDTLSRAEIDLVKEWITKGAKDICGDLPRISPIPISIETDFNAYIRDSIAISTADNRLEKSPSSSFIVHSRSKPIKLKFKVSASDYARLTLLSNPTIRITDSMDDFSNARAIKLTLVNNHFEAELKPSDFKTDKVYYMRMELRDDKTRHLVSYPTSNSTLYRKLNWSFFVAD